MSTASKFKLRHYRVFNYIRDRYPMAQTMTADRVTGARNGEAAVDSPQAPEWMRKALTRLPNTNLGLRAYGYLENKLEGMYPQNYDMRINIPRRPWE